MKAYRSKLFDFGSMRLAGTLQNMNRMHNGGFIRKVGQESPLYLQWIAWQRPLICRPSKAFWDKWSMWTSRQAICTEPEAQLSYVLGISSGEVSSMNAKSEELLL